MDLSGTEAKSFSFKDISPFNLHTLPISITVSGIHRAVLEDNLDAVKHLVDAGEPVNIKEHYEFTPLHLAVITNSEKILDYLLSRDDIETDATDCSDATALRIASGLGAYESVKKLIHAGANVNLPDKDKSSPLHASVCYPDICHLLIQNGAHIDAVDSSGHTALHYTVLSKSLEAMYMLLYYNADANVPDEEGMTPFIHAIVHDVTEAQSVLLDYVDDFNEINYCSSVSFTVLGLALHYSSPFIKEIIERGADVNYDYDSGLNNDECAFITCLSNLKDESVFKAVWERLRYYQQRESIDLCRLFYIMDPRFLKVVVQIIIESDNLELAVDSFMTYQNLHVFVDECLSFGLEVEQLVVLTYRLLEYGYGPTMDDVYYIFFELGACELQRILFYMDVDYGKFYHIGMSAFRLFMFDLDWDTEKLANDLDLNEYIPTFEELIWLLERFHDSHFLNSLRIEFRKNDVISEIVKGLPKVRSLVEFARNEAREHIRRRFEVNCMSMWQFYTIIDYLDIPSICKSILTYKTKIYNIK